MFLEIRMESEINHDIVKISSDGNSGCVYKESLCTEEGQVIYKNGSSTTDSLCRCDNTRGYDFIHRPQHRCYCVQSKEDCSCYFRKCSATEFLSLGIFDGTMETSTAISTGINSNQERTIELQEKEIMKWRKSHVHFEETTASKTVLDKMKTHGFIILSGPPGSGKSAIAYNTAFLLEKNEEFKILPVSSPEEIKNT
ncbi:unnamed protein product [Mytilus edulis]|uniref:Novel STAND NTPase 3 domain-containing protein n=1 Tax=Mytilus edulis TaxID=6550 RepID=A0A8S3S095_MYTED|nr:unnamed protein product [Mytilus edulis]